MSTILAVGFAALFLAGLTFLLLCFASFVAALAFEIWAGLEESILASTVEDLGRRLRQMPVLTARRPRHRERSRKPTVALLALDPLGKSPQYLCGFNPLHHLVFTRDRSAALRLNLNDKYLIEKLLRKAEDNELNLFLVLAGNGENLRLLPSKPARPATTVQISTPRVAFRQNPRADVLLADVLRARITDPLGQ